MLNRTFFTYTQIRQCAKKTLCAGRKKKSRKMSGKMMLLMNTLSCGILMGLGDLIRQEIEYRAQKLPERYDYTRFAKMATVGLCQGPLLHVFYGWLYIILPKRDFISIIKKILLDECIMSPICITEFFYVMNFLNKKPLKECNEEFVEKFFEVYRTDWSVWPPTQFINFYLIPAGFQVIYINCVTMLYNVYLSYIKHRSDVT